MIQTIKSGASRRYMYKMLTEKILDFCGIYCSGYSSYFLVGSQRPDNSELANEMLRDLDEETSNNIPDEDSVAKSDCDANKNSVRSQNTEINLQPGASDGVNIVDDEL